MMIRSAAALQVTLLFAIGAASGQELPPDPLVSGAWLQRHIADPSVRVVHIDARRDGYDAGHIPGARFIQLSWIAIGGEPGMELPSPDSLDRVLEAAGVADDVHVVIASGSILAATRLWLTLDYLGHGERASILDGGMPRWQTDGRPLEQAAPPSEPGTFTPHPRPTMLADADWIAARLDDPAVLLLDARPENQYSGSDGGQNGTLHAGHIPGAVRLTSDELLRASATDPTFLPPDLLRARFEAAGATADRVLVPYCMVGGRASLVWFVGRMLGYDMRFYDGSWHDWGARDLPFVAGDGRR